MVPADKCRNSHEIASLMVKEGVTYTSGIPSEYELLFKYAAPVLEQCKTWRFGFGGGEYLSPRLIREFAKLQLPDLRLFNNYDTAEVTTAALKGEIQYRDAAQIQEQTIAGFVLPTTSSTLSTRTSHPYPLVSLAKLSWAAQA